jgi:hypothetical protein
MDAPIPTILSTWHWGNLASVAANADNNLTIPTGDNVHGVIFKFRAAVNPLTRAQLITDVALVQLMLNGEVIYDRTTTQCLDEYKFHKDKFGALAAPLGCLVASCMNHNLSIWDQRRGAALGMLKSTGKPGEGPYNTLTARVVMTAGVATAVACEVHVVTDIYPQEQTGMHVRRKRTTRDLMAAGDNFVQDLPRDAYGLLNLRVTTALVDRIDVLADSRYIYRDLDWQTLQILQNEAGRIPQAGYTDVPFDLGNDLFSCLPYKGLSKLIINLHTTGAPGAGAVLCTEELWDHVRE